MITWINIIKVLENLIFLIYLEKIKKKMNKTTIYTKYIINNSNNPFTYIDLNFNIKNISIDNIKKISLNSINTFFNTVYNQNNIDNIIRNQKNKLKKKQTDVKVDLIKSENVGSIYETEYTIKILTKNDSSSVFFTNEFDIPSITINSMSYNNLKRYNNTDVLSDKVYIVLVNNKNICKITIYENIVLMKFENLWNDELINKLIKIFDFFEIVAITKSNIKFYYNNNIKIHVDDKYILDDLLYTSDYSEYIYINEINKIKKKNNLYIDNIKFTLHEKVPNYITFKVSKYIEYYSDVIYIKSFLDYLFDEYNKKQKNIIKIYSSIKKTKQKKKTIKTKLRIYNLNEKIPLLFNNYNGYSQKCQKLRQPYIIDSIDEFKKNLQSALKSKYPDMDENTLVDIFLNENDLTLNDLVKELPENDIPNIPKKLYACIPRELNTNQFSKPIPGLIKNTIFPCCFDKKCLTKKKVNSYHVLKYDKLLTAGRNGYVQLYISDMLGDDYLRYGVGDFEVLIELLYNQTKPKYTIYKIDKKNKRKKYHILLSNNLFFIRHLRNDNDEIIIINDNEHELNFNILHENIYNYLLKNKKKNSLLNVLIYIIKENFNFWSHIFGINFIIYDYNIKNNYLFNIKYITHNNYIKYAIICKNSLNIYEIIEDVTKKKDKYIHNNTAIDNYLKYLTVLVKKNNITL